jgi:hypothetical protein
MYLCGLTRGSFSVNARAVALGVVGTLTTIGSPGCEVWSGLNRLEPVACLGCDDALPGDSGSDAEALESSAEDRFEGAASDAGQPDVSGLDTGEPDVSGSDADPLDAPRCDAASDCGACTYAHANGLGQDYFDCAPPGTYDLAQATEACAAYAGDSSQCSAATCGAASVVCSSGAATSCACWGFAGAGAGHVHDSGLAGALNCVCPGPAAPAWN